MGRRYSQDLRERVLGASAATSRRQAAARFGVGIATVICWMEAPDLAKSVSVATRFADLVRRRSGESLEAWFAAAAATPLAKFAVGLERDRDALRGAITTPWSTSPVEGQIGRLKMLKRTMFGRAGFALLRQRALTAI